MNIVVINGSKRKGNTYNLIRRIEEYYKSNIKNISFSYIHLGDYEINNCLGCEVCIIKDKCPFDSKDDTSKIMNQLNDSDAIILSSPVYLEQISGLLKTFIDRTCKWFHRPELICKPILIVSTTASSGLARTTKYLESVAVQWGAVPVGIIKRKVYNYNTAFDNKEKKILDNFINFDIKNYNPSFYQLTMFQVQRVLANKIIEIDKEFWNKKEWMNKIYYYDKNIPYIKRIYANLFFKMLNNRIKPVKK